MLSVRDVSLRFRGYSILEAITMEVKAGSIHALIGPNGAGKTSLLNCITGFYRPYQGSIRLGDTELIGLRPDQVSRHSVTRMFQNIELFPHLSVLNNILVGRHLHVGYTALEAATGFGRMLREEVEHRKVAEDIIAFLDLEAVRDKPVASQPYGIQKKVELGRALATEGSVLLLDEPFGGLSIEEKQDMARYILETWETFRTTVLLIDHDVQAVADVAERITVLDHGRKIAEGEPRVVLTDPRVLMAYLGSRGGGLTHGSGEVTEHG